MHMNTLAVFDKHALKHFPVTGRVLEVGPDASPSAFRKRLSPELVWESAELRAAMNEKGEREWGPPDGTQATYWLDHEYEIPAADGTFDVVFSANVGEHVREVWTWMRELARVTRPGGLVITITPLSWPYHPSPYDCWRIHADGAKTLATYAGLEPVEVVADSLEPRLSKRTYMGTGMEYEYKIGWKLKMLGAIGWPMAVAEDLVSVARKPR